MPTMAIAAASDKTRELQRTLYRAAKADPGDASTRSTTGPPQGHPGAGVAADVARRGEAAAAIRGRTRPDA
jgi:hypothetical protein